MVFETKKALQVLKNSGLILYPTDTIWGIGCDATNPFAVKKIYELKQRVSQKALICLVSDWEMLKNYVEEIPEFIPDILNRQRNPTTVIYNNPKNLPANLIGEDNTIGMRICKDEFCNQLIRSFKKPIVSTSANVSGHLSPETFEQISSEIAKGVDYIVNLHKIKIGSIKPSTIIKIEADHNIKTIRK